jgi:hypothetical protein
VARYIFLFLVGEEDDNVVRTSEEGEGGADGEGEGEEEEEEEEEDALARTIVRKRGNAPVWFHTRVSSPPSKSSSSEDNSSSTSVSPGPSNAKGFIPLYAAPALLVGVGRLHDGKMRGGWGSGAGSGRGCCVGEDEGEGGRGRSRWKVP